MARSTIGWALFALMATYHICVFSPNFLPSRFGRQALLKIETKVVDLPSRPLETQTHISNSTLKNETKVVDLPSRPLETQARISNSTVPCVTVIAFSRPKALQRILERLNELDYGSDDGYVKLTISIDKPSEGINAGREESVSVASAFEFQHGYKVVDAASSHRGIVRQWVEAAWSPDLDPGDHRPACLILEDDLVPSKFAWRWMRQALSAYSQDTGEAPSLWSRVASLALQRPTLVPAMTQHKGQIPPQTNGQPFLYKLMATWGFVALRHQWIAFRAFVRVRFNPGHYKDIMFQGKEILPSVWHKGAPEGIWSYWFLMFMDERNLFTLYANLDIKATLCTNMRESGLHFGSYLGADFPTLESEVPALHSFPRLEELSWFDWDAKALDVESLKWKPQCNVAIATVATEFTSELSTFLRSVQHFYRDVPIYIAGNSNVSREVTSAFPESHFMFDTSLEYYGQKVTRETSRNGQWINFQMEKARVLRNALNDGCRGAWFFEPTQRLFSPLPVMNEVQLGLTPNRLRTSTFGTFNAGGVYVSRYEPLDLWEVTSFTRTRPGCCQAQVALDDVSKGVAWADPGKGVNVGAMEMISSLSENSQNNFNELKCQEGKIMYRGSELVTLHFTPKDFFGRQLVPFLKQAVKDCGYPLWLGDE